MVIRKDFTNQYMRFYLIENQRQQLIQRAISHQEYWANQHEIYEELKPIVTAN